MTRLFIKFRRKNEEDFILINLDKIDYTYFKDTFKGRKYFVAVGKKNIKLEKDEYLFIWEVLNDKAINETNVNLNLKNKTEKEDGKGTD